MISLPPPLFTKPPAPEPDSEEFEEYQKSKELAAYNQLSARACGGNLTTEEEASVKSYLLQILLPLHITRPSTEALHEYCEDTRVRYEESHPNHIPRPLNSYLIFSWWCKQELPFARVIGVDSLHQVYKNSVISKRWKFEEVGMVRVNGKLEKRKIHWHRLQEAAKVEHWRLFPDYAPKRQKRKTTGMEQVNAGFATPCKRPRKSKAVEIVSSEPVASVSAWASSSSMPVQMPRRSDPPSSSMTPPYTSTLGLSAPDFFQPPSESFIGTSHPWDARYTVAPVSHSPPNPRSMFSFPQSSHSTTPELSPTTSLSSLSSFPSTTTPNTPASVSHSQLPSMGYAHDATLILAAETLVMLGTQRGDFPLPLPSSTSTLKRKRPWRARDDE